jgi:hypothetical protein
MSAENQSRRPGQDARARRSADALSDPSVLIEEPLALGRTGRIGIGRAGAKVGWVLRWDGSQWVAGPRYTPTSTKTMDYTAALGELVLCNPTSGGFNVVLPPSPADGSEIIVKNHSDSANPITILPYGQDEIDSASSADIITARASVHLVAIAGGWVTVCCDGTSEAPEAGIPGEWQFNDAVNSGQILTIGL